MSVTVEELRDFLSGSVPRIVPPNIRRSAVRRIPRTIIAMGMIFALFSVPFMTVFFPWRLLDDLWLNAGAQVARCCSVSAVAEILEVTKWADNSESS